MHGDAASRTLTVTDDGTGMSRQALSRYHDRAATSKRKGHSIAGVGIKLGLLISDEVVTETLRARSHLATSWRLTAKNRAAWRWVEPLGLQRGQGTTVRLFLRDAFSELLEPGYLEATLIQHFPALLDPDFDGILSGQYPSGVRLERDLQSVLADLTDEYPIFDPSRSHARRPTQAPLRRRGGASRRRSTTGRHQRRCGTC